jgi:hypothetical protein
VDGDRPVWLSGEILTFLNKLVFPIIWLAFVVGTPMWVFIQTGRLSIAKGWGFLVAFALAATLFLLRLSARLERVGYSGQKELRTILFVSTDVP